MMALVPLCVCVELECELCNEVYCTLPSSLSVPSWTTLLCRRGNIGGILPEKTLRMIKTREATIYCT